MAAAAKKAHKHADSRVAPGDGRLNPVNHIVRIVVVRTGGAKVPKGAGQRERHSQSHGLSDTERETAREMLMKMPPPTRRDPQSTSDKPRNMFEALKPTDIVVIGAEAASVRTEGKDGKPKPREVDAHDDHNRDTVLRVWTEADTIEYQCDEEFEIVRVEKAGWKIYGAPDDPFGNGGPYRAQPAPRAEGQKPLWVWRSGLLPARADNQQYKMTFKVGGVEIDPDVACGNPPPSP